MELETWIRRVDGVTFVGATCRSDAEEPTRVRIVSRVEPVWPPRRHGVPLAGWNDGGYEGVVDAGEAVALGFATPATVDGEPVAVAWTEPAAEVDVAGDPVRALGDPRPPRDAVPSPQVLPAAVADWLNETTERVEIRESESTDREALRRVAARARAALRAESAEGDA